MPDIVEYYLEKGANDWNGGYFKFRSINLFQIIKKNVSLFGLCESDKLSLEEFQLLIEKKANPNARNDGGKKNKFFLFLFFY